MAKDTFYFKHDYNARGDEKITPLLMEMGAEGYGIYWLVIEKLYEASGRLDRNYSALSWALHVEAEKIKAVVEKFKLFYSAEGKIACERVDRDLSERQERIRDARRAGKASANKRALNERSADVQPGEERRGERGEEITTAPSAVDLSKNVLERLDARQIEGQLADARLPFGFGAPPDRFEKGVLIQNLPVETCKAILAQMPRLGGHIVALLKARIAQKEGGMTSAQRRAAGARS